MREPGRQLVLMLGNHGAGGAQQTMKRRSADAIYEQRQGLTQRRIASLRRHCIGEMRPQRGKRCQIAALCGPVLASRCDRRRGIELGAVNAEERRHARCTRTQRI